MTLGLASPPCGLMHDSAHANRQANRSRRHTHKCLMNNTDCVCHGFEVGAGFERREGGTGANRVSYGARATDRRHSQNGPEPRTVCGPRIRKRPTERGWALNFGGVVPRYRKPPCLVGEDTVGRIIYEYGGPRKVRSPPRTSYLLYPRSIRSLSTPAPCRPFRQAADTWGWMSDYLMVQGQPLTTNRPSSRTRHSTSRSGISAPSIEALYLSVR